MRPTGIVRQRWLLLAGMAMLGVLLALPGQAANRARASAPVPAAETIRVALIADQPQWPAAEAGTARLLDFLAARRLEFVVHLGGIKGDTESCGDTLLSARQRLLDQSPLPLVYLPGETDWAECARAANGRFDAVERLNRLPFAAIGKTCAGTPGASCWWG